VGKGYSEAEAAIALNGGACCRILGHILEKIKTSALKSGLLQNNKQ
jgi:hypothetical protein